MAMEKHANKKRSRGAGGGNGNGDDKQTRRQKRAMMAKTPYFTPKPSTSTRHIDTPLEQLMPQQRIDLIADLSESILEDPITALTSSRTTVGTGGGSSSKGGKNEKKEEDEDPDKKDPLYHKTQSKMTKLLDLAFLTSNGHDAHAARLALLSLLAIFQDILPAYRIRLPTEAEMSVRVSKDTKATWDYERKLLQAYQRYLQILEKTWEEGKFGRRWDGKKKGNNQGQPPTTLAATAVLSLSALLQTCYNFNFRSNLLQIVVKQANHRSSEEVRSSCCTALSQMFIKDVQGDSSLEAVRLMAKMIKQQCTGGSKPIHPDLLNTWLSLPLRVHEDEAMAAKLALAAKAKKAKRSQQDHETLEIQKEMKEGEATVDKLELAKNQADSLHTVTLTYFRILKLVAGSQEEDNKANAAISELLSCALRGLARFSHLIHMDAVVDLLAVLKDLLGSKSSTMPPDAAINCILCALKTLRGPGRDTLPVDPKEYLIPLYNILPKLGVAKIESGKDSDVAVGSAEVMDKTIEAAIQCLDHSFLQRRELSTARLAAFVKRIVSTTLYCPPNSATPLLACARQVAARYSSSTSSKVGRMLENEDEIVAEGMFAPDAEDPEHSNAHATSLWELALLKYSIHPKLADHSIGMAEGRLLKFPAEAPSKIWTGMGRDAREAHISQRVVWKKHPLENKVQLSSESGVVESRSKKRQQRRAQNQVRFITPRRTGNWHMLPATSNSML